MRTKLCVLIFGHKHINYITKLIKKLENKDIYFLIHIDKKSNLINEYKKELINIKNFYFLPNMDLNWGDWSFVECIINGMKFFYETKKEYDFLMFLTETDILLKKPEELLRYLENNKNNNFYQIFGKIPVIDWHNNIHAINSLQNIDLFGGSTFWTLKREFIGYALDFIEKNKSFVDEFKSRITFIPDETFFSSIFSNSKYYETAKDTLMLTVNGSHGVINKKNIEEIDKDTKEDFLNDFEDKFFIRKATSISEHFLQKINY